MECEALAASLKRYGTTVQPFLQFNTSEQTYCVQLDRHTWVFENFLEAMDVLIKLSYILGIEFQTLILEFWDFLSGLVYNLPYDGTNDSLIVKVREMGVAQKAKDAEKKAKKKVAAQKALQNTQTDSGAETDPATAVNTNIS